MRTRVGNKSRQRENGRKSKICCLNRSLKVKSKGRYNYSDNIAIIYKRTMSFILILYDKKKRNEIMESGQIRSDQVWLNDVELRMIEIYVS